MSKNWEQILTEKIELPELTNKPDAYLVTEWWQLTDVCLKQRTGSQPWMVNRLRRDAVTSVLAERWELAKWEVDRKLVMEGRNK